MSKGVVYAVKYSRLICFLALGLFQAFSCVFYLQYLLHLAHAFSELLQVACQDQSQDQSLDY
jgi:hypothetical protein